MVMCTARLGAVGRAKPGPDDGLVGGLSGPAQTAALIEFLEKLNLSTSPFLRFSHFVFPSIAPPGPQHSWVQCPSFHSHF